MAHIEFLTSICQRGRIWERLLFKAARRYGPLILAGNEIMEAVIIHLKLVHVGVELRCRTRLRYPMWSGHKYRE